ncbi:MAG: MBL fold metallo-hydrolase [Methylacidiphilales bacterium]|nr:MBL fold metallo-hydrolase [Candidatus Methylacidiphilales bacterium]
MRAIFLGTADGHTSARREHSGILIQTPETSILLDCGAAAARFLLHKKIEADVPEILWISHMHSDHNGQVSSLIQSLWLRTRRAPLHVFGPAEVLMAMKDWLEKCLLFPELIGFPIHWHAIKPGKPHVHGQFTFTAFPTQHLHSLASHFKRAYPNTCFDCYGVLLEYEGKRYVYSADLAHPSELAPVLKGGKVNALLCELTHFPERDLFQEVAQHPVQSVWITHYPDHLVRREAELKLIAREEKYRGEVHLMHDRVAHEI